MTLYDVIELDPEDTPRLKRAVRFAVERCATGVISASEEPLNFPVSGGAEKDVFKLVDGFLDLDQAKVPEQVCLCRPDGSPLLVLEPLERKLFLHLLPKELDFWVEPPLDT